MKSKPWAKLIPFFCAALLAIVLGVAAVNTEQRSQAGRSLLIVLGVLSWGLGEYLIHRFAFHLESHSRTLRSFYALHLAHHDDPQALDQLFVSPWMFVIGAISYCAVTWAIVGSWQRMSFLFIGALIGYCIYEWLHYKAHHGHSTSGPLKYLKKYHMLHHGETPNLRFGVTSPLFDCLFGTFQSVADHH